MKPKKLWVGFCEGCDGCIEIAVDPDPDRALEWTSKCPYCDNGNEVLFVSAGSASRSLETETPQNQLVNALLVLREQGYLGVNVAQALKIVGLASRASAPTAEQDWQPIATAPKDRVIIGALIRDGNVWRVHEMKHNGLAFYTVAGGSLPQMTHWIPLPALSSPSPADKAQEPHEE